MQKFRTKRNFPGSALVQTIAVVIVNNTFTFQTQVWSFHGNWFYPGWFASCFCTKASGAEPSYVTKFRCHYQMELQGQLPERKILYVTSSPTHLPKPLLFATVLTKRPEHPRGGHHLKVRPSAESNWKFSLCAHGKGIRAFDLLTLHPSECSWAIVFHKGQNADSTVQAKCKLEKLHIAFLGLTQASRWK